MYVNDGNCVEIDQSARSGASAGVCGSFTMGLLGRNSISREKQREEGQWPHPHIVLGLEFDVDSLRALTRR